MAVLGIILYILSWVLPIPSGLGGMILVWLLVLVVGCAAFTVRGYELEGRMLRVRRLLWETPLNLAELLSVDHNPTAMRWSLRLMGNGGFFAITGWFRNRTLGKYRAFVTDPKRAVVMTFADRVVVVSPDPPARFVRAVREMCGLRASSVE